MAAKTKAKKKGWAKVKSNYNEKRGKERREKNCLEEGKWIKGKENDLSSHKRQREKTWPLKSSYSICRTELSGRSIG